MRLQSKLRELIASTVLVFGLSSLAIAPMALTGCAAFGIQRPQSFDQQVVAGYQSVATVADLVAAVYGAGKISQAEANEALDKAQAASDGIGVAVSLKNAGDFSNAETRLAAVIAALELLQSELGAK